MAKNNKQQENNGQKVQTRYERKMEERRKQEEKDKKNAKILRISAVVVCVVIAVAIIGSIASSIISKNEATKDTYITVGNHQVTKLEFDYYYSLMKNNYITSYGSLLSYMGVDTTRDIDSQQYGENMTYKDFFNQLAAEQIRQTKLLADDAAANNFSYDDTEDYAAILDETKSGAEAAGVSINNYYQTLYGKYATEKNLEPFAKEGLLAGEYYNYLIEQNAPNEQEIKDYYEANVQDYDRVDYHSFIIPAEAEEDASEEDMDKAMMDAKNKADAMAEELKKGADFRELCLENSSEENKEIYENKESDASLREGAYYSSIPSATAEWLYEDGRKEEDVTVLEDTANNQYCVVKFVKRYYDEADNENISNVISSERVSEYINSKMDSYAVADLKGELKYLEEENTENSVE